MDSQDTIVVPDSNTPSLMHPWLNTTKDKLLRKLNKDYCQVPTNDEGLIRISGNDSCSYCQQRVRSTEAT